MASGDVDAPRDDQWERLRELVRAGARGSAGRVATIACSWRRYCGWLGPGRAGATLGRITSWARDADVPNEPAMEARAKGLVARCTELQTYIDNNEDALIDYGQRYRAGKPISTSRAEGTINQLVSARMSKRKHVNQRRFGAQENPEFSKQCGANQRRNPLLTHRDPTRASHKCRSSRSGVNTTHFLMVPLLRPRLHFATSKRPALAGADG